MHAVAFIFGICEVEVSNSFTADVKRVVTLGHTKQTRYRRLQMNDYLFPDLFRDFKSAAEVLKTAKPYLIMDNELEKFYVDLDEISIFNHKKFDDEYPPIIIVIEGIDGSGKSTLVNALAHHHKNAEAIVNNRNKLILIDKRTPMEHLISVRKKFDCLKEVNSAITRAFYMVTNYLLVHEMRVECRKANQSLLYVVDRFFTSTCAYTLGKKADQFRSPEDIEKFINDLPPEYLEWPTDLRKPDMVLLLKVDEDIRLQRISARPLVDNGNPWDDRLRKFEFMGPTIVAIMERMKGINTSIIDANGSELSVYFEALGRIESYLNRKQTEIGYCIEDYGSNPLLDMRKYAASKGYCDAITGKRKRQMPFAMTITTNSCQSLIPLQSENPSNYLPPQPPPSIRQVGINLINEYGLTFASRGVAGGGSGFVPTSESHHCLYASFIYVDTSGSVENEVQYRGEGIVRLIPSEVAEIISPVPSSLQSEINLSSLFEATTTVDTMNETDKNSLSLIISSRLEIDNPTNYKQLSNQEVNNMNEINNPANSAKVFQLIPYRMEILRGSPSTERGPFRVEWYGCM